MRNLEALKDQIANLESSIVIKQSEIDNFEYECSESEFDEVLDDCNEAYQLGGMTFYPSDILKSCDPIAYRISKSEYESNFDLDNVEEYNDLKDELEILEYELELLDAELEILS